MFASAFHLALAAILIALNGFFVAAEFAFVKVRPPRLGQLAAQGRAFSATAVWLAERMDGTLAACQLGITMASLGLGWVGEPAFAALLEPVLHAVGVESAALLHGISFVVAFTLITALHLTVGEQIPKIFAIRRPEPLALACAPLLKFFYVTTYPLLVALSATTTFALRRLGIDGDGEHSAPHSEAELRALVQRARAHGEVSGTELRLIHAVFDFDEMLCRQIMLPRGEIVWFDAGWTTGECVAEALRSRHSRYPVGDGSLDRVIGVAHAKDLLGIDGAGEAEPAAGLREVMRPPRYVPESMPVSKLLRHFQATHQHLAMVVDEHGTVIGMVTLDNVIEQIVGPVEDEFDIAEPDVVPQGDDEFLVRGSAPIEVVNRRLGLALEGDGVDTLSGVLMTVLQRVPAVGDAVELPDDARAEVLEVIGARATRVRVRTGRSARK
ncbi:MAG: hemolysin family protein [Planctomycetota bacterium]